MCISKYDCYYAMCNIYSYSTTFGGGNDFYIVNDSNNNKNS